MLSWDDIRQKIGKETYETLYDDFIEQEHQTQFYSFEGGFTFILRSLKVEHEELGYITECYVYLEKVVYLYNFQERMFHPVTQSLDQFLDRVYERFENNKKILLIYNAEVEVLEDMLYERRVSSTFMDHWFDLKKDISRIERFFHRQLFAYKDLLKFGDKKNDFPSLDFNNMINDIQFALATSQGSIGRLENLHNYYSSIKDDKLNRNIYFLTLLSGIFLPLNLIVGFFGMNTENLIFKDDPMGTQYVIYILGGILATFLVGFNIIKVLDRLFLRWWLGRSTIYRKMARQLDKIEQSWKI